MPRSAVAAALKHGFKAKRWARRQTYRQCAAKRMSRQISINWGEKKVDDPNMVAVRVEELRAVVFDSLALQPSVAT